MGQLWSLLPLSYCRVYDPSPEGVSTWCRVIDTTFLEGSVSVYLKKFLTDEGISVDFNKCVNDKKLEDFVLNDRIDGVKKFKVNATPTIIINNEKFEKSLNYKNLKKTLEKLI